MMAAKRKGDEGEEFCESNAFGELFDNATLLTEASSTLFNPPISSSVEINQPSSEENNASLEQSKSKRTRENKDEDSPRRKRIEVLTKRRKNVFRLYQQHLEKSSFTEKILIRLRDMYKYKVLPLERANRLHSFCLPTSSPIADAEFLAKPMVLIIGPYSTGKTTFITHLLGGDFPGVHIGPEPTTDKFIAVVHGNENGVTYKDDDDIVTQEYFPEMDEVKKNFSGVTIKGNSMTVMPELPFASLSSFGSTFLNHFNGSACSSPLLRNFTIVDTPGVLSGEKQRLNRSYDFAAAAKWFADRSDLILLLFDAHKLDVSDEFKQVVETIRTHNDDKIRCVLNKADSLAREEFVRVYGSLMWSMGKLFKTPEVVRVYTGSYWDEPLKNSDFEDMFQGDEWLLMEELMTLSSVSAERRVNDMVKRIRLVKVHLCILGYIREQVPWLSLTRRRARQTLLNNLDQVFETVCKRHDLAAGDMPEINEFRKALGAFPDFSELPPLDIAAINQLDELIDVDVPNIMKRSQSRAQQQRARNKSSMPHSVSESEFSKERGTEKHQQRWYKSVTIATIVIFVLICVSAYFLDFHYDNVFGLWEFSSLPEKYDEVDDGGDLRVDKTLNTGRQKKRSKFF